MRGAAVLSFCAAGLLASALTPSEAAGKTIASGVCAAGGKAMRSTTLFFGTGVPGGGKVSDADWRAFLDKVVTSRFPEGFTVFEARGQWRDARTGRIVYEPSRALQLWYRPTDKTNRAVETIRAAYKTRFAQDSVMRVDDLDCVSF